MVLAASCLPTVDEKCAQVSVGDAASTLTLVRDRGWCASHPTREEAGSLDAQCCGQRACAADCTGLSLSSVTLTGTAPADELDAASCCVLVRDGVVTARWVGYD